jgi:hypothetical protein
MILLGFSFTGLKVVIWRPGYRIDNSTLHRLNPLHNLPLPWYAIDHMPLDLSEEDAFNLALRASVPPPPPTYQWAASVFAPAPPPSPLVAPAFAWPVPDCPWVILDLVDQTQVPNDDVG